MPVAAVHGTQKYFSSKLETRDRTYTIRCLLPDEVAQVYEIALSVYCEDELPSLKTFINIHKVAEDLCLGYFDGEKLISFIWATRYYGSHITADTFDTHMPTGENLIIHSICTDPKWQHQGIALTLIAAFISHVKSAQVGVVRILLLCHAWHIPFFTRANFVFNGKSSLALGPDLWYECELRLAAPVVDTFMIKQEEEHVAPNENGAETNLRTTDGTLLPQLLPPPAPIPTPPQEQCPTCGSCIQSEVNGSLQTR
ncbi:serotonin N-acetyltransferase-like [Tubulanus polymorphus]|uniref:serotonin N-acetyltransferase-like n=1 Tax=Tubulanus polymorphus TaxID=672921 RepID=UPI003DA3728E